MEDLDEKSKLDLINAFKLKKKRLKRASFLGIANKKISTKLNIPFNQIKLKVDDQNYSPRIFIDAKEAQRRIKSLDSRISPR